MKYRFLWCWKISKLSFCLGKVGKVGKVGKTSLRIRLVLCPDLDVIVKNMDFSTSPEHSKHFASFTHSHTFMQACIYTWVLRAPWHNQQGALILRSVPLKQVDGGADSKRTNRREKVMRKAFSHILVGILVPKDAPLPPSHTSAEPRVSLGKFLLAVWTPSNWFMKESQSLISTNTNKTSLPVHSAAR